MCMLTGCPRISQTITKPIVWEFLSCISHVTPIKDRSCFRTGLGQADKSALCEIVKHRLVRTEGYMDRLVKEAIEIQLHSNNFNRDGTFMLSRTWQRILKQLQTAPGNQWDCSNLRTPPTDTYWLAHTYDPNHPWVYKQGKWNAESYHCPDDG